MTHTPYLLVGGERSGTTLLRLMLDSHPEVSFLEEFEYAVDQIPPQTSKTQATWPDLQSYHAYLERHRIFGTSGFEIDKDLTYPELINSFLAKRQTGADTNLIGATLHYGFGNAPVLWPEAKYINIVRDPRDVSASIVKLNWEQNVYNASNWWKEAVTDWLGLKPQLDPTQWIEIRYEDLITDHTKVLKQLCEFMGVDHTTEMVSYASQTDYDLPSPALAADWRKTMSERNVRLVETHVHDLMTSQGYEPRNDSPAPLTTAERIRLKGTSTLKKHQGRVAKYGAIDHFGELLGRKLRISKVEDHFRAKLHETETSQLKKSWRDGSQFETSAR